MLYVVLSGSCSTVLLECVPHVDVITSHLCLPGSACRQEKTVTAGQGALKTQNIIHNRRK